MEKAQENKYDIFEDLWKLVGCPCISDLKSNMYIHIARDIFFRMDKTQYTKENIQELVDYLSLHKN